MSHPSGRSPWFWPGPAALACAVLFAIGKLALAFSTGHARLFQKFPVRAVELFLFRGDDSRIGFAIGGQPVLMDARAGAGLAALLTTLLLTLLFSALAGWRGDARAKRFAGFAFALVAVLVAWSWV
jgi:hypothetical protein